MDEIVETIIYKNQKSTYRLELRRTSHDKLYVSIEQKTDSELYLSQKKIEFRASALKSIIAVLTAIEKKIPKNDVLKKSRLVTNKQEVIRRYLNTGLEIEVLAVQYDSTVEEVKKLLVSEGIVVTSNKLPLEKPRKFWRRKKKSGR